MRHQKKTLKTGQTPGALISPGAAVEATAFLMGRTHLSLTAIATYPNKLGHLTCTGCIACARVPGFMYGISVYFLREEHT